MQILKNLTAATAIVALTTPAFAGGLSDQIMEAPVVVEEEMAPAGSSLDPALIVLGILGLLLLGANLGDDDNGGSDIDD
jgi:hypothetical protein